MRKIAVYFLLLLVCAVPALAQGRDAAYRVGPRDLLDIKVFEDDKLNGQRRVSADGALNLPLLGDVAVAEKTTAEIARILKRLLEEKYMQRATVDVQVTEFNYRPIVVMGAVKEPGNLGFSGYWTLLETITASGGLAENHGSIVHVLRRADNGLSDQIDISLDELLLRGDPKLNLPIYANDVITVPGIVEVTVYCLGEVARPGALTFKGKERVTLLAAMAQAGGLTDRAAKRILIRRSAPTEGPREITVDFKRILAGKDPDVELMQGDIIVVKESFF
jgi:polysaccharide biosynthesis/export protein